MHDHWKPYITMQGVLHVLYNARHLRELKALMEMEREPWGVAIYRFLRQAYHAVNTSKRNNAVLKPDFAAWLQARYDRIVAQGLAFHEAQPPPGRKAAKRRNAHAAAQVTTSSCASSPIPSCRSRTISPSRTCA